MGTEMEVGHPLNSTSHVLGTVIAMEPAIQFGMGGTAWTVGVVPGASRSVVIGVLRDPAHGNAPKGDGAHLVAFTEMGCALKTRLVQLEDVTQMEVGTTEIRGTVSQGHSKRTIDCVYLHTSTGRFFCPIKPGTGEQVLALLEDRSKWPRTRACLAFAGEGGTVRFLAEDMIPRRQTSWQEARRRTSVPHTSVSHGASGASLTEATAG